MAQEIFIPDLGGVDNASVIEIHVKAGDHVNQDDSLITLESDKASMDVPAPFAGTIEKITVKVGDSVTEGDLIAHMQGADSAEKSTNKKASEPATSAAPASKSTADAQTTTVTAPASTPAAPATPQNLNNLIYASPLVRRLARELGIDLSTVAGTARNGRISAADIQRLMQGAAASGGAGLDLAPPVQVDFNKFGDTEAVDLSRIKKISAKHLHRNWVTIPHVTQFDEADITEMEDFRKRNKERAQQKGFKLTPLVFLMKAAVSALKEFPEFNSSLSTDGTQLILKKYFHIGVAVDTPNGLVVPVIRDVDSKNLIELAKELAEISSRARAGKLLPQEMQGSSFSISSLGGIGGTAFTPIINAPDVAILGVSRSSTKPIFNGAEFVPRLMLPLSLSYDHRVIDGAQAARFITHLSSVLSDLTQLLL